MSKKKIAILVGSLRKESLNRKIAKTLIELGSSTLDMEILEIGQLPLYNEDEDKTPPASWVDFRNKLKECDGVLFVTPEYNRSVPGALKNAIDVGSRPYGQSAFDGQPGAIVSGSPGAIGGFGANHHLRQSLVFLNVPCLQQPEAYVGDIGNLFDENDKMKNEKTREFLNNFIKVYTKWVDANAK